MVAAIDRLTQKIEHLDVCIDGMKVQLFDEETGAVSRMNKRVTRLERIQDRAVTVLIVLALVVPFLTGSGFLSLSGVIRFLK